MKFSPTKLQVVRYNFNTEQLAVYEVLNYLSNYYFSQSNKKFG